MSNPDAELARRAERGDDDAFARLVEGHSTAVFRVCYRITGSEERAEDAVQETFISAHRALGSFAGRSRFSTWLHRIAVNAALQVLRREKGWDTRRARPPAWDPDTSVAVDAVEPGRDTDSLAAGEAAWAALEQLSGMERSAVVLRHFEQVPLKEIAARMQISESAAKQAVLRGVRKLRELLGDYRDIHETA